MFYCIFMMIRYLFIFESNLLLRFTRNQFYGQYHATIGVEFASKELTTHGKRIQAQVWVIFST